MEQMALNTSSAIDTHSNSDPLTIPWPAQQPRQALTLGPRASRASHASSRPDSIPTISWFLPSASYPERLPASNRTSKIILPAHDSLKSTLDDVFDLNFTVPMGTVEKDLRNGGALKDGISHHESTKPSFVLKVNEQDSELDEQDEDVVAPPRLQLAAITCSLMLATFVVALDNAIIATAIPRITTIFNSLDDTGWYGSAYLLTLASLQPTFGKLYTFFPIKLTFMIALAIFEVGSIVCATAQSSKTLIIGRAVAGVGASAIFSGGMTIIGYTVPLKNRAFYIAALTGMFGLSSIIGPLLGGIFTDKLSWRWCFWINLPIGGIAVVLAIFAIKEPRRQALQSSFRAKLGEMDLWGAAVIIFAVVSLLLALQWGGTIYPWSDPKVWGCLLAFGLLTVVFVALQIWLGDKATLPPRILKQRTVACSTAFMAMICMGFQTHVFYLPFYFQAVRGTSAEGSGIRVIPYLVANIMASLVVAASITRWGYYTPFMYAGAPVFAVGSGLLVLLKANSSTGTWVGYQLLASIGGGACMQIPFISVQVVLAKRDLPTGTALVFFANSLGSAIAVSADQNILTNVLVGQLRLRVPEIDPASVLAAGAAGVRSTVPSAMVEAVLLAYNYAVTRVMILPAVVAAVAFVVSLGMEQRRVTGNVSLGGGA